MNFIPPRVDIFHIYVHTHAYIIHRIKRFFMRRAILSIRLTAGTALLAFMAALMPLYAQEAAKPPAEDKKDAAQPVEDIGGWRVKDFKPYVQAMRDLQKLSREYSENLLKVAIDEYSTGLDILEDMENEVAKLTEGGVVLNVGSAVTGPEVLLKAVSMAANVGCVPHGIVTADFDLRAHEPRQMTDEAAQCYYFRDQKSVVTRIPEAFGGRGLYIQGDQKQTIPFLYRQIIEHS